MGPESENSQRATETHCATVILVSQMVRAGGFEPPRSFEHGHLKTARLPFRHARNGSDRTNLRMSD